MILEKMFLSSFFFVVLLQSSTGLLDRSANHTTSDNQNKMRKDGREGKNV